MQAMPRPRPKFTQREETRHGKVVWYFRKGDGPRIRLMGEYGSKEWTASYEAALTGSILSPAPAKVGGTLQWLVTKYEASAPFKNLAPSTQRMRSNVLKGICATAGSLRLSEIDRKSIAAGRDRRADTPFAAITYLKTLSQLFDWAVDADYMTENPAKGVKRPDAQTQGFTPWSDDDVARFYRHWPVGSKQRLAMDLMLFTGLRRGDAIQIGRQHVRDNVIEYRAGKNGAALFIPIYPPLAASIAAAPTGDLTFLVTGQGRPFTAAGFGNWFGDACRDAGLSVRAHGLRKRAATIVAENGGTHQELKALFGWKTDEMVGVYTKRAEARRLAATAAGKLNGNILSPHPASGAGKSAKIAAKTTT